MRELQEETGLTPLGSKYLFSYKGKPHKDFKGRGYFRDCHKVFLVKTHGTPTPKREIKKIAFFKEGSSLKLYYSTKKSLDSSWTRKNGWANQALCLFGSIYTKTN
jgi:hypothetical protein